MQGNLETKQFDIENFFSNVISFGKQFSNILKQISFFAIQKGFFANSQKGFFANLKKIEKILKSFPKTWSPKKYKVEIKKYRIFAKVGGQTKKYRGKK